MANKQEFTLPSGIGISANKAYFESTSNSSSISSGAIITPGGAGFGQSVSLGGSLQLFNSGNFTALKSAAVSDAIYTLPSSYPATGTSVLQSDTAGLMTWVPMTATGAASGFTTLNSLTAAIQYLSFGYNGTVPGFSSSGSTHTLNIPIAGTGSTGLVSTQSQSFAGIKTFTNAVSITDNTGSGSYTTGALTVSGGVGIGGTLNVQGDLNVQGTFTTINSTTINVADKNIELGVVASPSDLTAQGGGITLRGGTDKSINWYSGVGWSSSESWNLAAGNTYKINNGIVLSATSLGTGVTNSSLTAVGIIRSGTWSATAITALYGGTGLALSFTVGDILYANSTTTWGRLEASSNSGYVLASAGAGATPTYINPTSLSVGFASTAIYAYQSGYAVTSGFATTANYAYQSGYGLTAGFATTAANVNVSNATSNTAHPLIISSNATGSGVALSTNTTLSYNPSTNILSTSGLAVTATTLSSSTSTGSLTVAGGVGIAGTSYFGNDVTVGNAQTGRLYFSQGTLGSAGTTTNPSLMFVGKDNNPITLSVLSDNTLSFEGSSGQLFSINNNLSSGTIFSVNDISGIPIIRANANGTLAMGEFTGSVGVGLSNPSYKLHIAGDTNLSSGYVFRINGTQVLSSTSLGTGVTNSSLSAVGTLNTGVWAATAITAFYGGTGYNSYTKGDILVGAGNTFIKLGVGTDNYVLTASSSSPTGLTWSPTAATGITTLNSLTSTQQYFATGASGSGFNISSSGSTHTFNIPIAGTGSTGLVSTLAQSFAGIKTFTNAVSITDSTGSGSYTTGALVVTGGVGIGGTLNVQGDFNVLGTFTTINSTTLTVNDRNIELGVVATPSDLTAEGGGITLKGTTDKSINWYASIGWSSSDSWNLVSGNTYKINNTTVLSSSSLGTGVTNSSLTALGTIRSGTWSATAITALYGGTGLVPSFTVGDILYANTSSTWGRLTANSNSGYVLTSAGSGATPVYVAPSTLAVGSATTATYAHQSGYAITSGLATTATYSYQSGYGLTSGFATTANYSYQSGYATTSGLATTATYAHQSGYATTSGFATTSTYSYQSGYASTSGIATSSYSLFVNSASANSAHSLLFAPISGSTSGSGVSVNSVLNYNPSTNILYTSGMAITATTASTSTSNGALQVAGGVGISGRLSFNQASFGTTGISSNPTIAMIGQTGDPIFMSVLEDNTISFEGSQGQLFSITPNLSTGYIYSVNDITGIPLLRANANANVTANEYAGNFGIGITNPGYKLHVLGSVGFTSNVASTSTTSGTLVVGGGVGIGGSLYVSSATAISGVTINNGVITGNLTGTATTATTSGFATTASYSYQAGYGLTAGLATTATYAHQSGYAITSGSSNTSGYATTSGLATTSSYSLQSGYAITSGSSGFATTASYSYQSGYGITAGLATTANYSYQAGYAITSGSSNTSGYATTSGLATTSTYSYQSGYGLTSGFATTASYAYQSGYAITSGSSGFATTSTYSYQAGYGLTAGFASTATYSYQSGYGITAGLATTANYAHQSGYAITSENSNNSGYATTSGLAITATYAYQSGYGLTSGLATTAQNINTVAAGTNANHHILFSPVNGGSGVAVSSDAGLLFNPASNTLTTNTFTAGVSVNAVNINVTGSTASTSSSTGALVVTGGVGIGGSVFVAGDLTINGTTTTINSVTLTVDDKNIELGSVSSPTDVTAEGGGITLRGTTDKSINWYSGVGWSSSESWNLVLGSTYKINNTTVLSSTSLGTGVTNSSLTALGTISTGTWAGSLITAFYGGTGYNSYTKGDILVGAGNTFIKLNVGTDNFVLTASSSSASGLTWSPTAATGITTLNSISTSFQYFATGYSGNEFNIASSGQTHTFNIPLAGTASTGLVSIGTQSFAGNKTFTGDVLINSSTASTNTSTGALRVNGGLGVSGQLSFGRASFGYTGINYNPSMSFIGNTSSSPITLSVLTDNSLSFEGSSGQLFGIDNNLSTGEIFSVSDISGLPIISASAGQTITLNEFGGLTRIGNGSLNSGSTTSGTLILYGGVGITGNAFIGGTTNITNSTASISTSSGALTVIGGVGIGGSLNVASATAISGVTINNGVITGNLTGTASTATYSHQSGYAITSGSSNTSGYATTSGLATTASNLNIVNASSGTFYPILSNAASSTSGIGASVNSLFSFNTANGTFGATSINISAGQSYSIGGNSVLSGTTLGIGVTNSSLTALGTITTGTWSATAITAFYGGTGYNSYTIGDILVGAGSTFIKVGSGSTNYVLSSNSIFPSGIGWTWVTAVGFGTVVPTVSHESDLWWNSEDGTLNYYYNDGESSQWVEISNGTGLDLSHSVHITATNASTGVSSGALIVDGGVGIAGSTYIGGSVNITNSTQPGYGSTTTGALVVAGGVGVGGSVYIGGQLGVGGTLDYNASGNVSYFSGNINSYNQVVVHNHNSGNSASSDFIVSNDSATDTTFYGDFGMNSSGWAATTSAFNTANAVYLASNSGDLAIGSLTANPIRFFYNNGTSDAVVFGGTAATVNYGTNSSSTTSGALQIKGGLGVTGNAFIGGTTTITNTTTSTSTTSGALTVSGGVGIGGTLNVGRNISVSNNIYAGTNTFAKAGFGAGDVLLDNGSGDTPGLLFYWGNNRNIGLDTFYSGSGTTRFRIVKELNETGGSELWSVDRNGIVTQTAWAPGEIIKMTVLVGADLTGGSTTTISTTSDTDVASYSYTPVSSNSYLVIEFITRYTIAGAAADDFISRIAVDGAEQTYNIQYWINGAGGGTRSGTLFPLMARYTNSSTSAKTISATVRRGSTDDNATVYKDTTTVMKITEIGR